MALLEYYNRLINTVSEIDDVCAIGKSGGEKLPGQGESDIDIFVFCDEIPNVTKRQSAINKLGAIVNKMKFSETSGKFWGICDFVTIAGIDICLMYFTVAEMNKDINSVLDGTRLDRENEYFYPTGQCATFENMYILYDKNRYIENMKEKLTVYPTVLSEKLFNHHIVKINDTEDFDRAVTRKDVLFYHSTLETAIDHFLQALFAFNKCYFPSRKRSIQFFDNFAYKPINCSERLLRVIERGSKPESLRQSYDIWSELCMEFLEISGRAV